MSSLPLGQEKIGCPEGHLEDRVSRWPKVRSKLKLLLNSPDKWGIFYPFREVRKVVRFWPAPKIHLAPNVLC